MNAVGEQRVERDLYVVPDLAAPALIYFELDRQCRFAPVDVKIITEPIHGALEIKHSKIDNPLLATILPQSAYRPPDPRSKCVPISAPVIYMYYKMNKDLARKDEAFIDIKDGRYIEHVHLRMFTG
jgi:hypothetical protein